MISWGRSNNNSGWSSGRGFGRGKGGNHGGKSNTNNNKSDSKSNAEMKFLPHYSGKQLTHTYDTVKDHIILQIQKKFK